MRGIFERLRADQAGSVIVEFALIGPAFLAMFLGVLHIGIGMQNYNALRSLSGDVARYAVVNYQTNNRLTPSQLEDYTNGIATQPPYGLTRGRLLTEIDPAATQRVVGVTEYSLRLSYNVPTLLAVIGIDDIPISFTRPIFVVASSS